MHNKIKYFFFLATHINILELKAMSPEKKTKKSKNENDENLPFDIYDSEYSTTRVPSENDGSFLVSESAVNVKSSFSDPMPNEFDEDDEEDFISKYFIKTIQFFHNMFNSCNCLNN